MEEFLKIYGFIKEQAPKKAHVVDQTLESLDRSSKPGERPLSARGARKP